MKVKYLGKNKDFLVTGEEYDISYCCNKYGASVEIRGKGGYAYNSIVDLALDWNILEGKFISVEEFNKFKSRIARMP